MEDAGFTLRHLLVERSFLTQKVEHAAALVVHDWMIAHNMNSVEVAEPYDDETLDIAISNCSPRLIRNPTLWDSTLSVADINAYLDGHLDALGSWVWTRPTTQ